MLYWRVKFAITRVFDNSAVANASNSNARVSWVQKSSWIKGSTAFIGEILAKSIIKKVSGMYLFFILSDGLHVNGSALVKGS